MLPQETEKPRKGTKKRESVTFGEFKDDDSKEEPQGKKFCQHHGTCGHTMDECTTQKTLAKQAKQKKEKHFEKKKRFTKHEVNVMVQKSLKKKKKKAH